jgi:hypothetical protein
VARERLTFRQRDVTAALRAVAAAGISVARIEIRKDGVVIIPGVADCAIPPDDPDNDSELLAALEAVKNAKI